MSAVVAVVPKIVVFAIAALIGGVVAFVAVSAINRPALAPTARSTPQLQLAAPPGDSAVVIPVSVEASGAEAAPIALLPDQDAGLAASTLNEVSPVAALNPFGFPRIPPITQFDGGPFQGANCTLASGAMLARLGYGIVTTGSILRTLQDDQDGGTGLDDLSVALWRGYGVTADRGKLRPQAVKTILANGGGMVIQGIYGKIPEAIRLQRNFTGGHAIYLDGYAPARPGSPEAYFVIDPIGRPAAGYRGEWWPASIVDDFATSLTGDGRIASMWLFPPGGVPPEVGEIDVVPIPPSVDQGPGAQPTPTPAPGETPAPVVPSLPEPGDVTVVTPAGDPGLSSAGEIGDVVLIPDLLYCLVQPIPPECPGGIEGVFEVPVGEPQLDLGPTIEIAFLDSTQPNVAMVGFTVTPPTVSDVRFWEADGSPDTVNTATSMFTLDILGKTLTIARLDVLAGTDYQFQVVAGAGLTKSGSPVGSFSTGNGVSKFDVALAAKADPVFELGQGYSPYVHLAPDSLAPQMEACSAVNGIRCQVEPGAFDLTTSVNCSGIAKFGAQDFCLRRLDPGSGPTLGVCQQAVVDYELTGIDGVGVLIRAWPGEPGILPDGSPTPEGVLEANGDVGADQVAVGCLASGLTYTITLDVQGDDRGVLAFEELTVP